MPDEHYHYDEHFDDDSHYLDLDLDEHDLDFDDNAYVHTESQSLHRRH